MKHLLSPLALCSVAILISSCANQLPMSPRPLGRYRYDPPDGPADIYYGPSEYPGSTDRGVGYPAYRTAANERGNPPLSNAKKSENFHGGPSDWYQSGVDAGRTDRSTGHLVHSIWGSSSTMAWSPLYARHNESYDSITEADFARGYNDAYSGRTN